MNDYAVAKILVNTLVQKCGNFTSIDDFESTNKVKSKAKNCGGFLCSGVLCDPTMKATPALTLYSLMYILACVAQDPGHVIIPALKQNHDWSTYLDRQQVFINANVFNID